MKARVEPRRTAAMDKDTSDYVELEDIETWRGEDIVTGTPDTPLVTIRGRDPRGEIVTFTLRFEDFHRIVETVQQPWHLDIDESSALAAMLILQQMAERRA